MRTSIPGSVGKVHRRPESEQFFRLAKTAKQAILVLSSMEPDAARREKGRSKPGRLFRQSLISHGGAETQRQSFISLKLRVLSGSVRATYSLNL